MNTNLKDWDWPVDVEFSQQPIGSVKVNGLIGPIYKFVLMPTVEPDDNGVLRVVSWSFVDRNRVLRPELIMKLQEQEASHER